MLALALTTLSLLSGIVGHGHGGCGDVPGLSRVCGQPCSHHRPWRLDQGIVHVPRASVTYERE